MTLQTQLVLRTLLETPARARYGLELSEAAGLPTGTIHPILARLENAGWLESFWEDTGEIEKTDPPRPRRRYYRFTRSGTESARLALAQAYNGGATSARLRPAADGPGGV
ncbi:MULTISPECIES: helix-turn-helix transcriptional regulator [unclassified Streptomyces]|uniref:helix-turn-helix transcriptional regulator n=1 Tax=unclassified Streptomyces TaxID=2593676 RepID=UPI001CBD9F30|nr:MULTISPECIES: helix-turn-helix transcriptional regulator [unclassified Streptomyces]WPO75269.1 helix-turn-helix transcriptional regulator [Streptomyces sp. KN37]